jgi:hypothetical protein
MRMKCGAVLLCLIMLSASSFAQPSPTSSSTRPMTGTPQNRTKVSLIMGFTGANTDAVQVLVIGQFDTMEFCENAATNARYKDHSLDGKNWKRGFVCVENGQ